MELQQNVLNNDLESLNRENNPLRTAKCWRCNEGINRGEMIRLCMCIDVIQFVHIECLEQSTNINSVYHCRICDISFPLERRNKPLIQWYKNRTALLIMLKSCYAPLFKLIVYILLKIGLINMSVYLIAHLDVSNIGKFIPILLIVLLFLTIAICPIYHDVRLMTSWIKKVYKSFRTWYRSNQEWKLTDTAYQRINETII